MANKRSAASSRGRDLFRAEVSSLLADLGELAGEPGPHPVPATTPPVPDEPAAQAREAVAPGPGADADAAPAPGPDGEADEPPSPPQRDDAPDEELISLSPSYLPPLPPVVAPLTAAPEPAAPFGGGILRRGAGSAPTALGGRTGVGGARGAVAGDGASLGPDLTSRAGSERSVALST